MPCWLKRYDFKMVKSEELLEKAIKCHQSGDLDAAAPLYREILKNDPVHLDALFLLGTLSLQQKDCGTAITLLKEAILINPGHADLYNNLGMAYRELGRNEDAIQCYQKALSLEPEFFEVHNNLGVVLLKTGNRDKALESFKQAIKLKHDYIDPYNNIANMFREHGMLKEAVNAFEQVIKIKPDFMEAFYNLGITLYELNRYEDAIMNFKCAIEINPGHAESHNNLGAALKSVGRFDEAISSFERSIELNGKHADAHFNLGNMLWGKCRHHDAIEKYNKALELDPGSVEVRWNRALALLLTGNYEQGWPEYEVRFERKTPPPRDFNQPRWDGKDLTGKTILVHAEQGFGDTFQFTRFLPMVKEKGGQLIFECQKRLLPVLSRCAGYDRIVPRTDNDRHDFHFDLQMPLVSLPGLFGITPETIPAGVPYILPDQELVTKWNGKLAKHNGFKIGIVWAGNPEYKYDKGRSCPLKTFAALSSIPGVVLFSLQKGAVDGQIDDLPYGMKVVNLDPELDVTASFVDTAAVIANLDLVISVESSVAHLAGAMGRQVWTIIPHASDWRWFLTREDSPWYPSMRLFRQTVPGDWDGVVKRVAEELKLILK